MNISSNSTVQDIFDQFNFQFPYLKLEFYHEMHQDSVGSKPKDQIVHTTMLKEINPELAEFQIDLNGEMTVSDFESMMRDTYKLNIQIFRKSAEVWLQTTATDHWTLDKQNAKGHHSTLHHDEMPLTASDFDLE